MKNVPLYKELATLVQAFHNCIEANNLEWQMRHEAKANDLVKEYLPSGSGFDSGTKLDFDKSTAEKLVFVAEFHHMNDGGYYDGWTSHEVIITPSLAFGFSIRVTGRDRNDIKDYIADTFHLALTQVLEPETV